MPKGQLVSLVVDGEERVFRVDHERGVYQSIDNPVEAYFFEEIDAPLDFVLRHFSVVSSGGPHENRN